ncbi:MAG: rhodanese-like domain-containing protein [Nitrospirae bacterium]|nr:rhodanese-like domain-containing protein [Nitrospirota bacterium]
MKKVILFMALMAVIAVPVYADDLAAKLNAILLKAPQEGHWQVKAADVSKWIAKKKTDFLIVDVRPTPPGQQGGKIPGSIYIPYNEILKPENLKKLPKDKKVVLVCVTGQTQNLPVLALRALGYDARTMSFGMSAWIKGYLGAKVMQDAINGAGNYPVE